MAERYSDITDELMVLYELVLASGRSLDAKSICKDFVSTLLARKDVSFAAVWLWDGPAEATESAETARLFHSAPQRQTGPTELPVTHPSFMRLRAVPVISIDPQDADYPSSIAGATATRGALAFFQLADVGAFELGSNRSAPFAVRELNQLKGVMEHLGIALKGALAHERLRKEVERRRLIEISLRKTYAELEQEIAARRRTAENLRQSEARFRDVAEIASDWIWETDRDHRFVYLSERVRDLAPGLQGRLLGRTFQQAMHDHSLSERPAIELLLAVEAQRSFRNVRYDLVTGEGRTVNLALSGKAILDDQNRFLGFRGTARDITDELQAQLLAQRNERLAAIGQLTGTVAHELRNPIGVIGTSTALLQQLAGDNQRLSKAIDRIVRSTQRCDHIISELLSYGRVRPLQQRLVAIDPWLQDVLSEQTTPEHISLQTSMDAGVTLKVDPERLQQAVTNVFENACQAMSDDDGETTGELRIESFAEGPRIAIAFRDTGPGMTAQVRENVFEPLFSTRSGGLGLGLPLVKQILEQHGGEVEVDSAPGKGATVTLWLPLESKSPSASV